MIVVRATVFYFFSHCIGHCLKEIFTGLKKLKKAGLYIVAEAGSLL